MPNYNEIEDEIFKAKSQAQDFIRRKYLKDLSDYKNVDVLLYSRSTNKPVPPQFIQALSINLEDVASFMTALNGMKRKELYLIIHSLGGSLEATEQIVSYLRQKYNKITAIIPQSAMSAATLLACACDEIIMSKHSAIGPIDPQIDGIPAHAILEEFKKAQEDVSTNPKSSPIWLNRIKSLPFGILKICEETNKLSKEKASKWLREYMFKNDKDGIDKAKDIAEWLGNFENHKTHGHPISITEAKKHGLKVIALEDDQELQDKVLSVFHSTMISFSVSPCIKIVENHDGRGRFLNLNPNFR